MLLSIFSLFFLSVFGLEQKDINIFNLIYDTPRFEKTSDLTQFPLGFLMATIPANTYLYRIETHDPSEIGHLWFCYDPAMCLTVGGATEISVYKTKQELRIMVETGRSTFNNGLESYFFNGTFGPGNDGLFPKLFCEMNDENGTLKVHGYSRFYFFWELVACRTERYLELVERNTYNGQYGIMPRTKQYYHTEDKYFHFDWTSLTLLKPDFPPQPEDKILSFREVIDNWKASPQEVFVFQQTVYWHWNHTAKFPISSLTEQNAIQQFEDHIQKIVLRFSPILKDRKSKDILEFIEYQMFQFGNNSEEALKNCQSFQAPTSMDLVSQGRKQGYLTVSNAIKNVLNHICTTLNPLRFQKDLPLNEVETILDKLAFDLHWSVLESCLDCGQEDCIVGVPFRANPYAPLIRNSCWKDLLGPRQPLVIQQ